MVDRAQITIKGVVQGVGFRPFVFHLAEALQLKGYVTNTPDGVTVDVEGEGIGEFLRRLPKEAPPLSQIVSIEISPLPGKGYTDFRIVESEDRNSDSPFTLISPDVSVCDDCLRELLEPGNRRYLYPFINCTNCGPRYSITKSVPYDRPNTTMAVFPLCSDCAGEYHDPKDRRFHAQPNACPRCGPSLQLKIRDSRFTIHGRDPLDGAIRLLKEGAIIAIKGLGGFHIACDATNRDAVQTLRARKRKSNKPFALMAPDIGSIRGFCDVTEEEEGLLRSIRRPIVLLQKKEGGASLPEAVSPNNRYLGFMLPYTPLHYLLFHKPAEGPLSPPPHFAALVMTSGNLSEEPIVKDNEEAVERLSSLVDAVLLHNRDIFMRVDDSVVIINRQRARGKTGNGQWARGDRQEAKSQKEGQSPIANCLLPSLSFIRRSRGYAPEAIPLHSAGPEVLGCGADLKNTFTLIKGSFAIPSQHIGDMENYETLRFFEECLENMKAVYRAEPVAIGYDLHPGYLSTQWALRQDAGANGQRKMYGIQHHYAHIGSVMAEEGLEGKVIGVAFDGTGYGTDGNLWGGEFLIAGIEGFERVGHFRYIPLPGGESAIREPWRTAVSYALDAAGDEVMDYLEPLGFIERYGKENIERVIKVCRSGELAPLSSGAGRLFDAVSAMIGLCDRNTYEGEAAIALEALIREDWDEDYPVNIVADKAMLIDFSPAVLAIMNDCAAGKDRREIATKFHNTVASAILRVVMRTGELTRLKDVALSGGTFQNRYLLNRAHALLRDAGMKVYVNKAVPCNDACISLGQAYLVRERMKSHG